MSNEGSDTQSYMYQLTINNPIEKGYSHEKIIAILRTEFSTFLFVCMADEHGSTHHTHLFVVFESRVRFSTLKRRFPEAHIEKCRGKVSENVDYIKKNGKWEHDDKHGTKIEGTYEEFGVQPPDSRGKNNEMQELYDMITGGMKNAEIIAYNQDYILNIDKIDKVRTTYLSSIYENDVRLDLQVIYVFGKTGTGKTRDVFEKHGYSNVYRVTDYRHPFDGYNCQPVIMFDEFRSGLSLTKMLLYCDIYPIELPARYSNKFACYNTVYIVSNWALEKQYEEEQKSDEESWNAFRRRIHQVKVYEDDGKITIYNSLEEYDDRFESIKDESILPKEFQEDKPSDPRQQK